MGAKSTSMAKRKVVEICTAQHVHPEGTFTCMNALCDDGTLWQYTYPVYKYDANKPGFVEVAPAKWSKITEVPQD